MHNKLLVEAAGRHNMVAKQLEVKKKLAEDGWCVIDYNALDDGLIDFSKGLGEIILDNGNVIHLLKPKEKNNGIKNSFSYKHGLGCFPYHTDTAFWLAPARYFVLASEKKSECATYLADFEKLINSASGTELNVLKKAVFLLKTSSESRFVSMLSNYSLGFMLRYDPNIMLPYNAYSKEAVEIINDFLTESNRVEVQWTGSNIAVIDNWRMLHSRSECIEMDRVLKRIYIK